MSAAWVAFILVVAAAVIEALGQISDSKKACRARLQLDWDELTEVVPRAQAATRSDKRGTLASRAGYPRGK